MSVELVLEGASRTTAQTVYNALDAYKSKLRASIHRTRRNLKIFEQRYGVTTTVFLQEMVGGRFGGWRSGIR